MTMATLKQFTFAVFIAALFCSAAHATTYTAASCNLSDVQTAVNKTSNGDTVIIPSCSQTNWGSNTSSDTSLTVNTDITIQGQGSSSTIIGDNIYKGGSGCSGGGPLIYWNVTSSGTTGFRLTGIGIVGVATDPGVCQRGHIFVKGANHYMEIDHITINPGQTVMIYVSGDIWGVITSSSFTGGFVNGVRVESLNWNGTSNDVWGDQSWAQAINYGGGQGVYIENNTFTSTSSSAIDGATDCFSGGQLVFRYNTVSMYNNQSHGADSDQRHRACRWQEIYNNTYSFSSISQLAFMAWIRGGTGVFYNNTITAAGYTNSIVQVVNCRDANAGCGGGPSYTPWGACSGSGTYDENSTGTGYRCVDQPGAGTSCLLGPDSSGTTVTVPACSLNGNVSGRWTGNQLDPVYVWNNTLNGKSNNTTSGSTNVVNNRDYYIGSPRPGYTAYTYPYPVGSAPTPPTSLQGTVVQ